MNKGKLSGILYMENNLNTERLYPGASGNAPDFFRSGRHIHRKRQTLRVGHYRRHDQTLCAPLFPTSSGQEIKRSSRHNKKFSLIMMDIDNFKSFNDTYGHQLGDKVLKDVARAAKKISRAEDIAARYGGEEFVMILPETDSHQAMIAAEKIRASVAEIEIPHEDQKLHVTISLGVSTYPEHAGEKEALIHAADAALYTSKHSGKNCVSLFEKGSDTQKT